MSFSILWKIDFLNVLICVCLFDEWTGWSHIKTTPLIHMHCTLNSFCFTFHWTITKRNDNDNTIHRWYTEICGFDHTYTHTHIYICDARCFLYFWCLLFFLVELNCFGQSNANDDADVGYDEYDDGDWRTAAAAAATALEWHELILIHAYIKYGCNIRHMLNKQLFEAKTIINMWLKTPRW